MTRRGGQLPWGNKRSSTLYGGPSQSGMPRLAMLAAITLGIVLLGFFLFTKACGSPTCTEVYCPSDEGLTPPDGYERVTRIYELNEDHDPVADGQDIVVKLELNGETDDGRNLSFFRYVRETGTWEPLAPASLEGDGKHVSGVLATSAPVMTVLRRLSPAGHVVAYLPANAQLHPDAAGKITILHTRDFTPGSDGSVEGTKSAIPVDPGVAWYPSISAGNAQQGSIPVVSGILASGPGRTRHVQQVIKLVNDNQLAGIDIAYLDLPATERTNFTLFVVELAEALHAQQKLLTLTLPPPQKTAERIDEGAYDWAQLGKSADILQIAPHRDQRTFRQVMPEILQFLTTAVEPAKLVLTVSPYATETSAEGIRTMPLTEAMVIATKLLLRVGSDGRVETNSNIEVVGENIDRDENLSGVSWSTDAASVYFTYKQGTGRTVFIENFFSLGFKLELIPQYKLGGVAVEDASSNPLLGDIWTSLNPFVTSGQPSLLQPNPEDLTPQWTVSAGEKDRGVRGSIEWATPSEPGRYTITLTLSDGVSLFQNSIPVDVQAKQSSGAGTGGG